MNDYFKWNGTVWPFSYLKVILFGVITEIYSFKKGFVGNCKQFQQQLKQNTIPLTDVSSPIKSSMT